MTEVIVLIKDGDGAAAIAIASKAALLEHGLNFLMAVPGLDLVGISGIA